MVTQAEHQEQTEQVIAKSQSLPKNPKAFRIAIGFVFLLAALNVYFFLFARQGVRVAGPVDGKIDKKYYLRLLLENEEINDISQVADILAEVNYLAHGEGIEQFRFTLYARNAEPPLRVRVLLDIDRNFRRLKKNEFFSVAGTCWPNRDIYLLKGFGAISFLKISFHELGHEHPRWPLEPILIAMKWLTARMTGNLYEIECLAEANVIDSIVALMYLDPALGYLIFQNYDQTFSSQDGVYDVARNYSLYRCMEGGGIEKYPGLEVLQEKIKEKTAGKTADQIREQIRQGVLDMFKEKFRDREDFEEKYSLLKEYFKEGITSISFDKSLMRNSSSP